MSKFSRNILFLVFSIILGLVIGYFLFSKPQIIHENTITTTDTIWKDSTVSIEVVKWKTKTIKLPNDTIFVDFDSLELIEIAKDYYSEKYFDTTLFANEVKLDFKAIVFQNDLLYSSFDITNNRPTIINNTSTTIYTHKFLIGGGLEFNPINGTDIKLGFGFQKKRVQYQFEYGLFNKSIGGKVYYSF